MISLHDLLSSCIDVSRRAGAEIVRIHEQQGHDIEVKHKSGPKDPVTIADVNSEKLIKGLISRQFPGLTIIGEESTPVILPPSSEPMLRFDLTDMTLPSVPLNEVCLWVDPLDGTLEFVEGRLPYVSVLLGISHRGTPVAGVLHQPFLNQTTFGAPGFGVQGCTHSTAIENPASDVCVIAHTFARGSPELDEMMKQFEPMRPERIGGSGTKGLALLEGKAHLFVHPHTSFTSRWDTCAIEAMLYATGGSLTDEWGIRYNYGPDTSRTNDRGLIAASAFGQRFLERYNAPAPPPTPAPGTPAPIPVHMAHH
ncbi:putative pap inositol 1; 4 phosphatase [Paratrimastix pyriformis]|uniref:3'(2'),5'-bisphosphate nucleotidase n=1 Tax=Paratrimastix pyriformis TaxID=342808 RepID=A0ABQ8UJY9_9EUKA|nr:putative pap inositol 1; 4 phosphatase [Paratrimastix pyriformis]